MEFVLKFQPALLKLEFLDDSQELRRFSYLHAQPPAFITESPNFRSWKGSLEMKSSSAAEAESLQ